MNNTEIITKENRSKLLVKYVVPSLLSMLSVFLFTIVDGVFVGQGVGTDALGAVNIVFPYVMIFNAFVMLTTIGGLTISAIRIGRGDGKGANEVFMHSATLTFIVSAIFSLCAIIFTEPLCRLMGADDTFIKMACDYLFWYGVFLIPCGLCTCLNGFGRNDGVPQLVTISVIVGTVLNIFGDWLLIFPLHMGLDGAAIATGVSQTISFLITLTHFISKKGNMYPAKFKINWKMTGKMIVRGLPECVSQFCVPLTTIITNIIMIDTLGPVGVNAYSIICYVACFSVAIFVGCAEGLQPLFGQCYGQSNEKELRFYKQAGIFISVVGSIIITIIIIALEKPICILYGTDAATMPMTLASFPKYSWGFIMQAINVIISAYLYSTTRTKQALTINILRSFVVNILVVIFLPMIFGNDAIWYTFGVFEGIVAIIAVILMITADKKGATGHALE